ncbi:MAG: radical SAM protein [Candidatus Hydrothermarchaeaceae archaeon]
MRILLIHPKFPYRGRDLFPLGLGYLASAVRDISEITVIDENLEEFSIERVRRINPDIIGITATTPSFPRAMQIVEALRGTDAKIVLGGTHATFMPDEPLNSGADIVVRGEGEATFRDIVEGRPMEDINGISWSDDGKIVHNPDRELALDLDALPFPAHEFFPVDKYGIMSIVTSRGCPFSCSYCSAARFWERRVRYRSPKNVVEELKEIVDLGFNLIRFMDSTFTLDKKRAMEICALIKEEVPNISWSCETRADAVDDELLEALADACCTLICIGVDSACDDVLDKNGRKMDTLALKTAFERIRKHKLRSRAYVTFGLIGETRKSVEETVKFLHGTMPDQVLLSLATAYPGTELWGGPYIEPHENWVSKFRGHGTGGKLYLPRGIPKKEYIKLADYMWAEVKKINKAKSQTAL